jgi:hypothetical protein
MINEIAVGVHRIIPVGPLRSSRCSSRSRWDMAPAFSYMVDESALDPETLQESANGGP